MKLKKIDVVILKELQNDGRISYSEIAKKNNIPVSTVHNKIQKYLSEGIIKKFTIILDSKKVNYQYVSIVGIETGAKLYSQVAENLAKIDEIVEIYGTTAQFDLMIKIRSSSSEHFTSILTKIRRIDGVDDIFVSSILETFKEETRIPL